MVEDRVHAAKKRKLNQQLHDRIAELELALAKSHALHSGSDDPHPLLESAYTFEPRDRVRLLSKEKRDELDAAERAKDKEQRDAERDNSDTPRLVEEDEDADMLGEDDDVVDSAFGTLTLGRGGHARYMGSFAGSEYLGGHAEGEDGGNAPQRPAGAGLLMTPPNSTAGLPMSSIPLMMAGIQVRPGADIEQMRRMLPDWDTEGQHLVKNYWLNVNWMYMPIPRPLFETDFLLHVYKLDEPVDAHKLACVFLVMALGVMFDLTGPPFRPRREELFALGQACLGSVGLERASLATVRALHLCGTYILNDNHGSGGEIFWPIVGMLIKVATGLGLHRDGTAFGLSQEETEDRRLLWWECVLYDRLRAMCFARPLTMLNKYTDTKAPTDLGIQNDPCQFHSTKLKLAMLMEKVIDVQTRVAPVPYSLVTQIDAEFKQFRDDMPEPLAPGVQINRLPFDPSVPPHQVIHRLGIRLLIAQSRLLLSRPFFRKALNENPGDPEFCKHGSSFVALYESATEIIFIVKQLVMYHPSLVARWWFYWFHAYSSAVCLAATTILAPMSPYATPAFEGLCTMYDIAKAAQEGCRAKKGLSALFRLKCRAEDVLRRNNRMGDISSARRPPASAQFRPHLSALNSDSDGEGEEDELSHLDGSGKLRRMPESNTRKSPPTALGLARQAGSAGPGAGLNGARATSQGQGHVQVPGRLPTPPMTGTASQFAHHQHQHQHQRASADLTSPLSDRSTATSTTLNETWEGIVPPPPPMVMDDAAYAHHQHQAQHHQHQQGRRPGMTHHFSSHSMSSIPEIGMDGNSGIGSNGNSGDCRGNGNSSNGHMMYPPPTPITSITGCMQQQQSYAIPIAGADSTNNRTNNGGTHSGSYDPQISPALSTATWNSYGAPPQSAGNGSTADSTGRSFDAASHPHHSGFTPQRQTQPLNFQSLSQVQAQVQAQSQPHSGHSISGQSMHSQATTMISPSFSSHSQSLPSGTPLWTANGSLASTSFPSTSGSSSTGPGPGMDGHKQMPTHSHMQMQGYAQPGMYAGGMQDQGQGQMLGGNLSVESSGANGAGWDFGMDADLSMALGLELEGDDPFQGTLGTGMGYVDNDGLGTFNWNDLFGGQGM